MRLAQKSQQTRAHQTRRMTLIVPYELCVADLIRLYLRNLPEKINKNELKRALYMLFTTYGPVLDIVTSRVGAKGQSMRGQAHVVYRDIQTSTQAMRALQGFDFFGKELVRYNEVCELNCH